MMRREIQDGWMTVGKAAQEVGIAASALRFYEDRGLLKPSGHSNAGYRLYSAADMDRLRFVRAAQASGFTLADIRALLELDAKAQPTCKAEVQRLLTQRLEDTDRKLEELQRVRETLGRALKRCRRSKGGCPILNDMEPPKRERTSVK